MSLDHSVEQRDRYAVVRLKGDASLQEMLDLIRHMGVETQRWPTRRVLFDLRGVRSLTSFTDHYAIGEETARQLRHLHRIASIVDPDRITRASEKTARQSGVNLSVFTTEAEAIAWLTD